VALGSGSVADADDTVSVGAAGATRRIVNVAAGNLVTGGTDVVNGGQLFDTNVMVAALDTSVAALQAGAGSASGQNATAVGPGSTASGDESFAGGYNSQATQDGGVALGSGASSTGVNSVAIGAGSSATGSVAVGAGASAGNDGAAVGDFAVATGDDSAALGPRARALAANSVAIGGGSVADAPNTVSFGGGPLGPRRLTNVAPGVNPLDAVNYEQFATLQTSVADAFGQISDDIGTTEEGVAMALAMAGGAMLYPEEDFAFSANWGTFAGRHGVAFGFAARGDEHWSVNAGLAAGLNEGAVGGRAGVRYGW
jgi:autotransporter adhesin